MTVQNDRLALGYLTQPAVSQHAEDLHDMLRIERRDSARQVPYDARHCGGHECLLTAKRY